MGGNVADVEDVENVAKSKNAGAAAHRPATPAQACTGPGITGVGPRPPRGRRPAVVCLLRYVSRRFET